MHDMGNANGWQQEYRRLLVEAMRGDSSCSTICDRRPGAVCYQDEDHIAWEHFQCLFTREEDLYQAIGLLQRESIHETSSCQFAEHSKFIKADKF